MQLFSQEGRRLAVRHWTVRGVFHLQVGTSPSPLHLRMPSGGGRRYCRRLTPPASPRKRSACSSCIVLAPRYMQ